MASEVSSPPVCETKAECLSELREASGSKRGMSRDDQALAKRLQSFGPELIPELIEILADPNQSAAELAAYVIRDSEHIDVRYLREIKAGLDRGLGWLAPALCAMDGDEPAREAVARFLVSEGAPHNQEAFAVERCGRRAIPFIVDAARCKADCDQRVYWNLGAVLNDMGEERLQAAPGLLRIATDPAASHDEAVGALLMISRLGQDSGDLSLRLLGLRERRIDLVEAIDDALVGIRSQAAGQILAERLKDQPNYLALRDLAQVGPAAAGTGPAVVDLLDHPDWTIRVNAARALGFIGYADAAGPLIRLLDDPVDVRLNWLAAESLGRLAVPEAIPALRSIADSHWYPPVRAAAKSAIEHIEHRTPYERKFHLNNFPLEFFDYQALGHEQDACERPLPRQVAESPQRKLHAPIASKALESLAFTRLEIRFRGMPADEAGMEGDEGHNPIEAATGNFVEQRIAKVQIPHVALRVENGWLVGSNRGEWGGELAFIPDNGPAQILLNENVEDIYELGGQVVALTGLAHLMSNHGTVHALARGASGKWSATPWRALPGAPQSSWPVDTGEVLINVASGGTLLLRQDGTFRISPCTDHGGAEGLY
jgi:HEAT repeat protein